jgi:hypothetical protein
MENFTFKERVSVDVFAVLLHPCFQLWNAKRLKLVASNGKSDNFKLRREYIPAI